MRLPISAVFVCLALVPTFMACGGSTDAGVGDSGANGDAGNRDVVIPADDGGPLDGVVPETSVPDVPRPPAAMFTISYGGAMVVSVAAGATWDVTGSAAFAFLPIVLAALPLVLVAPTVDFRPLRG